MIMNSNKRIEDLVRKLFEKKISQDEASELNDWYNILPSEELLKVYSTVLLKEGEEIKDPSPISIIFLVCDWIFHLVLMPHTKKTQSDYYDSPRNSMHETTARPHGLSVDMCRFQPTHIERFEGSQYFQVLIL